MMESKVQGSRFKGPESRASGIHAVQAGLLVPAGELVLVLVFFHAVKQCYLESILSLLLMFSVSLSHL